MQESVYNPNAIYTVLDTVSIEMKIFILTSPIIIFCLAFYFCRIANKKALKKAEKIKQANKEKNRLKELEQIQIKQYKQAQANKVVSRGKQNNNSREEVSNLVCSDLSLSFDNNGRIKK